ncbi:ATP-binding cassette domain-containing protein [Rhizobium mongolense]|uniref:ATP-binding cassette domain-containing protein n=1 Tax=Rhizobium mongolense TaxID=57676 RepID=UPI003F5D783A
MGATVSIDGVSKAFGSTEVLKQIAIDVQAGAFMSLLGPSGCGKSTLLRIVAGFEAQDRGTVSLDGLAVDHLAPRARDLAMVFQRRAQRKIIDQVQRRALSPDEGLKEMVTTTNSLIN